jgi:hypothetical protein
MDKGPLGQAAPAEGVKAGPDGHRLVQKVGADGALQMSGDGVGLNGNP